MQTGDLKITDGPAAGAWIEPGLGGEFGAVTLQVPKGYEAYARIFHPAGRPGGKPIRWSDVAKATGRTAHREMQPADRSWFVASEVDFDSTLVGGSAELIKAIVESRR